MAEATYIHGTSRAEQERLARLNALTNPPFLAFLNPRSDDRVLEVGSGLGILANEVAARCPRGEVVGVEYSVEQLANAQRTHPNIRFLQGDAHNLQFPDDSFDLVYCRYVLEHVGDPGRVTREMYRVLKRGGRACAQENNLLVTVFDPDCPAFSEVWTVFVELQGKLGGDGQVGKRLLPLFTDAGFAEVKLSIQPEVHWTSSPGFAPWIENLIGNIDSGASKVLQQGLASADRVEAARDELRNFLRLEKATAIFYWNRAEAVKG